MQKQYRYTQEFLQMLPDGQILGNCILTSEEGRVVTKSESGQILSPEEKVILENLKKKSSPRYLDRSSGSTRQITYEEYFKAVGKKEVLEEMGISIPQDVIDIITQYEDHQRTIISQQEKLTVEALSTPIYSTLKANAKFPLSDEKKLCIESTVEKLLEDSDNALEPGLLLGKIQCGKTDTFENIIGLSFDKGVDIAVVLTKGTKALAEQTIKRLKKDFRFFKETDSIDSHPIIRTFDIMKVKNGIPQAQAANSKIVIVCKKEATNLRHLINLYTEKSKYLLDKRTIIIDDEADFASRNYSVAVTDGDSEEQAITLAPISQLIDKFRDITESRYLQVTATPYALLLQPNGEIPIFGGIAKTFKPRFSKLVPVHNAYIGGKQYFEDSKDPKSMYSHLFNEVPQKCMDVMLKIDRRYLNNATKSNGTFGLTRALMAYLMATAIRSIQQREIGKKYMSSAVIHVATAKKKMAWQAKLVEVLLEDIGNYIRTSPNENRRLKGLFDDLYSDFCESNKKAKSSGYVAVSIPEKDELLNEIKRIFEKNDKHIQIVNSDNDIQSLLNEDTGELKLNATVNIFIGGNILDRGITIQNMLCFFYGRNPGRFQQDTVLQHARMYGARSKEDMAVTRLHTTRDIYDVLVRMNELDEDLRKLISEGKAGSDITVNFVGFDGNIRPCASSKIRASETYTLKPHQRTLPIGFKTGSKTEISKIVGKIDQIIKSSPNFNHKDESGFFLMDKKTVDQIIKLIISTYIYSKEDGNMRYADDVIALESALSYCMGNVVDGMLYVLYRENRNMNRLRRENGGYIDAPDDGRTDLAPSKIKAFDRPVLMLLRQNGAKSVEDVEWANQRVNIGWSGTPFYWPVLLSQLNVTSALYVLHEKKVRGRDIVDETQILQGINPEEVLKFSYVGNLEEEFGLDGADLSKDDIYVSKATKDSTASNFMLKDEKGELVINKASGFDEKTAAGVYSYNKGKFPFILRPYRYLLLRSANANELEMILLELEDPNEWKIEAKTDLDDNGNLVDRDSDSILINATDILVDNDLSETEDINHNLCQWIINYKVKKVVRSITSLKTDY